MRILENNVYANESLSRNKIITKKVIDSLTNTSSVLEIMKQKSWRKRCQSFINSKKWADEYKYQRGGSKSVEKVEAIVSKNRSCTASEVDGNYSSLLPYCAGSLSEKSSSPNISSSNHLIDHTSRKNESNSIERPRLLHSRRKGFWEVPSSIQMKRDKLVEQRKRYSDSKQVHNARCDNKNWLHEDTNSPETHFVATTKETEQNCVSTNNQIPENFELLISEVKGLRKSNIELREQMEQKNLENESSISMIREEYKTELSSLAKAIDRKDQTLESLDSEVTNLKEDIKSMKLSVQLEREDMEDDWEEKMYKLHTSMASLQLEMEKKYEKLHNNEDDDDTIQKRNIVCNNYDEDRKYWVKERARMEHKIYNLESEVMKVNTNCSQTNITESSWIDDVCNSTITSVESTPKHTYIII